jgi:hypothetical protein
MRRYRRRIRGLAIRFGRMAWAAARDRKIPPGPNSIMEHAVASEFLLYLLLLLLLHEGFQDLIQHVLIPAFYFLVVFLEHLQQPSLHAACSHGDGRDNNTVSPVIVAGQVCISIEAGGRVLDYRFRVI